MERAILDRIGFDTYASFMMGTSIQHVDTEREERLEISRAELAAAEDALAALEEGIDAELALAALVARRRDLRDEAARLLGRDPGDDIEWALRHHRVEVRGGGERTQRLRAALRVGRHGARVRAAAAADARRPRPDLARRTTRDGGATRRASARSSARSRRIQPAAEGIASCSAGGRGRRRSRPARARPGAGRDDGSGATAAAPERGRGRGVAPQVESRSGARGGASRRGAAAHRRAGRGGSGPRRARVGCRAGAPARRSWRPRVAAERQAQDALDDLTRLVRGIGPDDRSARAAVVGEAEAAVAHAEAAVAAARFELTEVDELLERLRSGRVTTSPWSPPRPRSRNSSGICCRGSQNNVRCRTRVRCPFVLDDALRGVRGDGLQHLLGRLERMSSAVQVVILSDDNEIAAWADAIGADRAVSLYPVPL